MTDILIRHVTAITLDSRRRVLEDAAVAVEGRRIVAVGPDSEVATDYASPAETIEARGMAALPGLIDCHSHAEHGLVRSLGAGDGASCPGARRRPLPSRPWPYMIAAQAWSSAARVCAKSSSLCTADTNRRTLGST